jgi:hypothetical protein
MPAIDSSTKDWLEAASYLATILGIPLAILLFWNEKRRERSAREEQVYLSPNRQYVEYLTLCFENPDLDIFDLVTPTKRSPENTKREWVAFTILISTMEQAYLLYRQHPNQKNQQWRGWRDYMRWWMARPNFRVAWEGLTDQFDRDFVSFVESLPAWDVQPGDFSFEWMEAPAAPTPQLNQPPSASS